MDEQDTQRRLDEANAFARTLVGTTRAEAVSLVRAHGLDPEPLPADVEAVTAELRPERVRLLLDESDRVVRAWAG